MRNIDLDQIWPFPQRRFNAPHASMTSDESRYTRDVYDQLAQFDHPVPSASDEVDGSDGGPYVFTFGEADAEALCAACEDSLPAPQSAHVAAAIAQTARGHRAGHSGPSEHALRPPPPPLSQVSTPPSLKVSAPAEEAEKPAPVENKTAPILATVKEPEVARPRARRDWTPLVWGGLGFIAGMLAWHLVGFWSFMSNVVLHPNDARAARVARGSRTTVAPVSAQKVTEPSAQTVTVTASTTVAPIAVAAVFKTSGRVSGEAAPALTETAAADPCVTLTLNRTSGGTSPAQCGERSDAMMRDAGYNQRADKLALKPRLQDATIWTGGTAVATTQAQEDNSNKQPDEPAIDYGTLNPADLNLNMD
ncbi:MAG: hypothetical protein KDJ17_01785 [Hyphomicrobiaceae bacterium]|nr:hypothetical protein [Hyphomicrobiaceae bacterium]